MLLNAFPPIGCKLGIVSNSHERRQDGAPHRSVHGETETRKGDGDQVPFVLGIAPFYPLPTLPLPTNSINKYHLKLEIPSREHP